MKILETDRLLVRELDAEADADFIKRLLNSDKFIQYIGDRKVRSDQDAREFIRDRYRKSYEDHGYGLYCVELKDGTPVGMCGFVRRDTLPGPDIGFAFLPEFEGKGYGFESAVAMMTYGRDQLSFRRSWPLQRSIMRHREGSWRRSDSHSTRRSIQQKAKRSSYFVLKRELAIHYSCEIST